MQDSSETHNVLAETSYRKTEAWHYRHAVVTGVIYFFSIFYLAFRGFFGAIGGFFGSIIDGWCNSVQPFLHSMDQNGSASSAGPSSTGQYKQYN